MILNWLKFKHVLWLLLRFFKLKQSKAYFLNAIIHKKHIICEFKALIDKYKSKYEIT